MASRSQLLSNFKFELLAKLIAAILGALLIPILARLLSPEGYGLLYLAIAVIGVAKIVSKLGIGKSAARYVTEYKDSDGNQVPNIVRFSFVTNIFLIVLVAVVLILGNDFIARVVGEPELATFLIVGAFFMAFRTLSSYSRRVLQGFEAIKRAGVVRIVSTVGKFVFAIGFVVLSYGAIGAFVGYALSAGIAAGVGLAIIYIYHLRGKPSAPIEPGLRRRILEYSVPLTASEAAGNLSNRIDTILIGFFLNPVAVSFYVIPKQIILVIQTPINALGFTLAPTFGSEKSAGNVERASRIYEETLIYTMVLYLPAAAGLILVAGPTIDLVFGSEYAGAVPVLQILSIYAIAMASNFVAGKALDFLGRARSRAWARGITAVMNAGLNIAFIPTIGVVGAAIATVITSSLYALANLYIINEELNLRVNYLLREITIAVLITLTMAVVVALSAGYIEGWISLIGTILLGVAVWGILSTQMGLIDIKEVRQELL